MRRATAILLTLLLPTAQPAAADIASSRIAEVEAAVVGTAPAAPGWVLVTRQFEGLFSIDAVDCADGFKAPLAEGPDLAAVEAEAALAAGADLATLAWQIPESRAGGSPDVGEFIYACEWAGARADPRPDAERPLGYHRHVATRFRGIELIDLAPLGDGILRVTTSGWDAWQVCHVDAVDCEAGTLANLGAFDDCGEARGAELRPGDPPHEGASMIYGRETFQEIDIIIGACARARGLGLRGDL